MTDARTLRPSLATQKEALEISEEEEEEEDGKENGTINALHSSSHMSSINVDEEVAFSLNAEHPELEFDPNYGLLAPEQTVIFRAYSDDSDDKVLEETNPRFIVMYEPNPEFIRRIEVCQYF